MSDTSDNKELQETCECPLSGYQDFTDNRDLDGNIHQGFKLIGKNGKEGRQMYFMMIWHKSGHCTIYPACGKKPGRWVNGDSRIKIYWI